MRLEFFRRVGVFRHEVAIGEAFAKQHVHDGASERAVGARSQAERYVGLLHRGVAIDVDGDDLGAALFSGARGVGHDVDLGGHRIRAPYYNAIALGHFARVGPREPARAGDVARPGEIDADGRVEARIFLGVRQAIYAVAHHAAHRARIVIGPDALGAVSPFGFQKSGGDRVERLVPRNALELARALRADALQGV